MRDEKLLGTISRSELLRWIAITSSPAAARAVGA
jgi:hypothetical protein